MLKDKFTGWARNCQFITVEEMMVHGKLEMMDALKPMITEPWCIIREMYKPEYEIPNRFNFLFLTNHENALMLEATDRRYCVLKTLSPPHPEGNAYYGPLFDWTHHNAPVILHYLRNRDLTEFQPKAHAPMTEGKRLMMGHSMNALDQFIFQQVEARDWPFDCDLVVPSTLVQCLNEFNHRVTTKEIGNALARLKYVKLDDKFRPDAKNRDHKFCCGRSAISLFTETWQAINCGGCWPIKMKQV